MSNVLWLQGGVCSGNTMSFLNAEEPSVVELITDFGINILWHPTTGQELGGQVQNLLNDILDGKTKLDIFVFEGTVVQGPDGTGTMNYFADCPQMDWVNEETKISDLTGIEGFVNLIELYANDNNLTSIDVTQNSNLEILNVGANNLEMLDLSNNLNLTGLALGENKITSFDATPFTQLTVIRLQNMQDGFKLTSVNTTGLTNLTTLVIGENDVEALDISTNTGLTYLAVNGLPLTSIDLSNNDMLNNFYGYDSNFTELDLSNSQNLFLVSVFNSPNLSAIDVKNGNNANLAALYVHQNPSLTCIQVDEDIVDNIPQNWQKDDEATYSSDCEYMGVDEITVENRVSVYPNPVKDVLHLNLPQNLRLNSINVFDVSGRAIFSSTEAVETIDFGPFQAGVYFVEMTYNNKRVLKQVVKQ